MGTNFHKIMGYIGGAIAFTGFFFYIATILRGETKPNRASWTIWALLGFVILGTYYSSGARNNLPATISLAIGQTITMVLSYKYGETGAKMQTLDKACLVGAIISIFLWKGFDSPVLGLSGALLTDFIGIVPTWRDLYKDSTKEKPHGWIVWSIGNIFNMFTIEHLTVQDALYPSYFLIATGVSTYLVLRRRRSTS